jgi:phosphocarrier protein HPr
VEFPILREAVVIPNKAGLHARPISQFVEIASRFEASLSVACNGKTVDGKSILLLMTLEAGCGSELEFKGEGDDAKEMIGALLDLVRAGFHED